MPCQGYPSCPPLGSPPALQDVALALLSLKHSTASHFAQSPLLLRPFTTPSTFVPFIL